MSYPPPPGGYPQAPQDHPRAMLALILGIVSLVCLPILGPFAWFIGKKAVNEIDASGGRMSGRGTAQAGFILGIISTVLLVLWVLFAAVAIPTGMLLEGSTG
jgi:uncharacterized membrane-anchored protein